MIYRIKHLLPLGAGMINDHFSSKLPTFSKKSTYYLIITLKL